MSLLSTLAAHDLGYLTTADLLERLDRTLNTLEGLERFRGHFLNWYDTITLAPLHPRYVSSVDSGNLAAALIAIAQGAVELVDPASNALRSASLACVDAAELFSPHRGDAERPLSGQARQCIKSPRTIAIEAGGAATTAASMRSKRSASAGGRHRRQRAAEAGGDVSSFWRESVSTRSSTYPAIESPGTGRAAAFGALARGRRRLPTRCASISCTTGGAASSRSAIDSPTRKVPGAHDGASTICWHRRRDSPVSWRSRRATFRSITGFISVAWSPTFTAAPRSCRGAARCSSI